VNKIADHITGTTVFHSSSN